MQVADLMTEDVLTVSPQDNALESGELLDARQTSAALVMEDGKLKGIGSKETFIAKIGGYADVPLEKLKVADFMEEDIDTVDAQDDIEKALELLLTQKSIIDRLPVTSDGKLVGLISKVDFTRYYAKELRDEFKVADLMHYNPVRVADYTPLSKVVEEMGNTLVKRVLVFAGEDLTGIITIRDVSIMLFRERKVTKGVDPVSILTAEDVMVRNPLTIGKDADASEAADLMLEKGFGGLPVVEEKLEGLISRTDLLKGIKLSMN